MGRMDDLISDVKDGRLRKELRGALGELKRYQKFGIVFEEHIPEISLLNLPVEIDSLVQRRDDKNGSIWRVTSGAKNKTHVTITALDGTKSETVALRDLLVVKRFGEPIYPAIVSQGAIKKGGSKPFHAVIDGENFHALQLFLFLYEGQVDCIYIDPPFNTGARDWKYNNRYVDAADGWKHSKWLSFLEKRLRLAKRLLKKDGVLIIAIDEHEVHHLGMLLERLFPEYLRYMITMLTNPKGTGKSNFSRVDEYVFFVVPNLGYDIIKGRPVGASLDSSLFDLDIEDIGEEDEVDESEEEIVTESDRDVISTTDEWEYRHARRRGSESSYRPQRPNQFYPIYINEKSKKVVRTGPSIAVNAKPDFSKDGGLRPIWPIDAEGHHRVWGFISEEMQSRIDKGNVFLGKYNSKLDSWTINYRVPKKKVRKLKTIWINKAYDAGTHGTELLRRILGHPGLFQFPKSVYAVRDCLAAVVRDKPNALIVDFFAGSGTTFHAACLLNSQDGGNRRTILVTNNELAQKTAQEMANAGVYRGDLEYEKHGIFLQVTRPRCEAIVRGKRPDGTTIPGNHIDNEGRAKGRPFSLGFDENIEFFKIEYLDPDDVDLGKQFETILPALWLAAGGIGDREIPKKNADFSIPQNSTYGILFRESRFKRFFQEIKDRPEINVLYLVTDSEEAYAEMRSALPKAVRTSMLYRDYLRNFQINGRVKL